MHTHSLKDTIWVNMKEANYRCWPLSGGLCCRQIHWKVVERHHYVTRHRCYYYRWFLIWRIHYSFVTLQHNICKVVSSCVYHTPTWLACYVNTALENLTADCRPHRTFSTSNTLFLWQINDLYMNFDVYFTTELNITISIKAHHWCKDYAFCD